MAGEIDAFVFTDTVIAGSVRGSLVCDLAGGGFLASQGNMVLVGGTGLGKTHLALGIARACSHSSRPGHWRRGDPGPHPGAAFPTSPLSRPALASSTRPSSSTPSPAGQSLDRGGGRRVSSASSAGFVLDAQEQALHDRRPVRPDGPIHHSSHGVPDFPIEYTERLAESGMLPSVGDVFDSDENFLAPAVIGPYWTGVIQRRGPGTSSRPSNSPPGPSAFRRRPQLRSRACFAAARRMSTG